MDPPLVVIGLLIWLVIGILAGYIAGELVPGYGLGLEGNILVGMLGAVVQGALSPRMTLFPGSEYVGYLLGATLGAVAFLLLIWLLKRLL